MSPYTASGASSAPAKAPPAAGGCGVAATSAMVPKAGWRAGERAAPQAPPLLLLLLLLLLLRGPPPRRAARAAQRAAPPRRLPVCAEEGHQLLGRFTSFRQSSRLSGNHQSRRLSSQTQYAPTERPAGAHAPVRAPAKAAGG